jgi:hypothetical protein
VLCEDTAKHELGLHGRRRVGGHAYLPQERLREADGRGHVIDAGGQTSIHFLNAAIEIGP